MLLPLIFSFITFFFAPATILNHTKCVQMTHDNKTLWSFLSLDHSVILKQEKKVLKIHMSDPRIIYQSLLQLSLYCFNLDSAAHCGPHSSILSHSSLPALRLTWWLYVIYIKLSKPLLMPSPYCLPVAKQGSLPTEGMSCPESEESRVETGMLVPWVPPLPQVPP